EEADTILFGRLTYQLMESFWPTKAGLEDDSVVAKLMNGTPKIVFSRSLEQVVETDIWKHVRLVKENVQQEIEALKQQDGKNIVVLGSNNFCVTLLELGLLDELRIMVNPVVIGKGTSLFQGVQKPVQLELTKERSFHNGNILLYYKPQK
ncbi:MAG: dihydrofolate reductase family protein, partial [Nitrosotalea sp.]